MNPLPKELEFICKKCEDFHLWRYGKDLFGCPWKHFDNCYCPDLEEVIKVMAKSKTMSLTNCPCCGNSERVVKSKYCNYYFCNNCATYFNEKGEKI